MGAAFQHAMNFIVLDCADCGMPFALNSSYHARRKEDGKMFKCPEGHGNVYKENEIAKLKRDLEKEQTRRKWAEDARDANLRSARALQGQNTKLKKRIAAGVCPCCNRTFKALAAHMKTKHPEWKADA